MDLKTQLIIGNMSVIFTNPEFPHYAVISRTATTTTPPYTATPSTIWSGDVDCQVGGSGATTKVQTVFVSDYTIYCACITSELQTGDNVVVTLKSGGTPINCVIQQSTTEDIWEVDGVKYGTTIWVNEVK